MPSVQALLADEGVSFANSFAATPLCGPSRATLLRGQYAHNHGIRTNRGAFDTFRRLGQEASTIGTWLHDAGYATALLGKYLNGYPGGADPRHVPPGWDEWSAFIYPDDKGDGEGDSGFYVDYQFNENGRLVAYGRSPED